MTLFVHLSRLIKELSFRYREGAPLILHREPVQFGVVPESKYSLMNTSSPLTPALLPAHGLRVFAGGGGGLSQNADTLPCKLELQILQKMQRVTKAVGGRGSCSLLGEKPLCEDGQGWSPEREEKIGKGTDASAENCLTVQGLREALR